MKVKKRKKSGRFRGSHTHGRGFKKKARGSGHRGGFGMAGTGKRGDQRKSLVINLYGNDYFGKDKALRRGKKVIIKTVTLRALADNIESFVKSGAAKKDGTRYEVDLKEYKIIGNDKLAVALIITCLAASKGATESIKKAGGDIIVVAKKEEKKENKKE